MRTFGRPQGILGRLGGIIMARTNAGCGAWVTDLLDVGPNDNVLEVGFGPGVVIQRLSKRASAGHVAGIDPSREMVEQARARNTTAIQNGRVDLRRGCSGLAQTIKSAGAEADAERVDQLIVGSSSSLSSLRRPAAASSAASIRAA